MAPALFEALILALIGLSGISLGIRLGFQAIPLLVTFALGAAVVLRSWSAFFSWSTGTSSLAFEFWIAISIVPLVLSIPFIARERHLWGKALSVYGGLSITALMSKYVLQIGERHHSDSADTVALALVAIQSDNPLVQEIADSPKRGIAYPLMLALGPTGRILGAFTPLVFLSTLLLVGWIVWKLGGNQHPPSFWLASGALAVFSLSVPMFRASAFYLNGHTLMGFGLLLMVAGWMRARAEKHFSRVSASLLAVGGAVGVTARAEGVVLVLVVAAFVVAETWWSTRGDRVRLFMSLNVVGLTLTWWFGSLSSPVLERFGVNAWLLVVVSILGSAVASLPQIDKLRRFVPLVGSVALLAVLGWVVARSGNPVGMILAQWPNLGRGEGGWGTAAHMFIASIILLAFSHTSAEYKKLLWLSALLIGGILFSKTFDGGFGRPGFYDSVNRMWLHVMPMVLTATLLGYTQLLASTWTRRQSASTSKTPESR